MIKPPIPLSDNGGDIEGGVLPPSIEDHRRMTVFIPITHVCVILGELPGHTETETIILDSLTELTRLFDHVGVDEIVYLEHMGYLILDGLYIEASKPHKED